MTIIIILMKRILALLSLLGTALAAFPDDLVTILPEIAVITDFKLYSGYLSIKGTGKTLHYMFAES